MRKITRGQLLKEFPNVRKTGYCKLSCLLSNHKPIAWASGLYGWNYDVYSVYGVTIATGYRAMPGATLEDVEKYEALAERRKMKGASADEIELLLKIFCELNGGDPVERKEAATC